MGGIHLVVQPRGAGALAVVDPAAGRLARTTGGPHEVTAGRTGKLAFVGRCVFVCLVEA